MKDKDKEEPIIIDGHESPTDREYTVTLLRATAPGRVDEIAVADIGLDKVYDWMYYNWFRNPPNSTARDMLIHEEKLSTEQLQEFLEAVSKESFYETRQEQIAVQHKLMTAVKRAYDLSRQGYTIEVDTYL